ncbi:heavy-metal-associated domain-containing protein [Psychroflexus sp. MES1-P1E]|uniref:heavy-metal-associated domain-containing protein n=1 Tax=Psychroflexus sp. MES1-P1E TaxID=2058320 RepID=UPI000C79B06E|nr:heavy metal-associated domain-containing protein [Psychroflexus sp. MES1-P1E]PKG42539.1 hypothetical protein CXF67_09735 [Psychroflexus sp. MES1-P1E]
MKHRYHIHGMTCKACSSNLEEIISKVKGVSKAEVNLEKAEATIEMKSHYQQAEKNYVSIQLFSYQREI